MARRISSTERLLLSRRTFATLTVAGSLSLAGCSGIRGDDDDSETAGVGAQDELAAVPATADGVLFADERMATGEETAVVLTGLVNVGTTLPQTGESELTYSRLVVELAASDVEYIDSTFFYRDDSEESTDETYQGAIIRTNGDTEGVQTWIESNVGSVETKSDADVTVSVAETADGELWLAALDESTAILGSEAAVTDSIDVEQGTGLSGALEEAYHAAGNGHMKALVTLSDDDLAAILEGVSETLAGGIGLLPDPQILTAMYATDELEDDGGTLLEAISDDDDADGRDDSDQADEEKPDDTFAMQLTMETTEDAESFEETVELVLDGDSPLLGEEIEDDDLLARLEVERDGEHVTIAFTTTSGELAEFFNGSTVVGS